MIFFFCQGYIFGKIILLNKKGKGKRNKLHKNRVKCFTIASFLYINFRGGGGGMSF